MPIYEYVTPSQACDYYLMNENHLRAHRTSFTNYIERKKRKKKCKVENTKIMRPCPSYLIHETTRLTSDSKQETDIKLDVMLPVCFLKNYQTIYNINRPMLKSICEIGYLTHRRETFLDGLLRF